MPTWPHQGNESAQKLISSAFKAGDGVPKDLVQAHAWYNLVAASSDDEMGEKAAERRSDVAANMNPAQIADAQKMAKELQKRIKPTRIQAKNDPNWMKAFCVRLVSWLVLIALVGDSLPGDQ